ncbi:MAG: SBBP repeat-containing protein [Candidatus Hydrogenedentales bacterium]|jgi:hypothetical protein
MNQRARRKRGVCFVSPILLAAIGLTAWTGAANAASLDWARMLDSSVQCTVNYIAIDGSGNVYTSGVFLGTGDFDPGEGVYSLTSGAQGDVFISKLDSSGNFVWARKMGGAGYDVGFVVAVDGSGNVYAAGHFEGTADFDPSDGTFNLVSSGNSDAFVVKLNAAGDLVWVDKFGGTGDDKGYGIAVDTSGNVLATGYFNGTADFDPSGGTFNLVSSGASDVFVAELSSNGALVWAKKIGGFSYDHGMAITVDETGAVYTTGNFQVTTDFDPGAGVQNLVSAGATDIFVCKWDTDGGYLWAKSAGGPSNDAGRAIALDSAHNVYIAADFAETADFDPGLGVHNLVSAGNLDTGVLKLDANGGFVWAGGMGGITADFAEGIAVDSSSNVYVSGQFESSGDFDPGVNTAELTAQGGPDGYIVKLHSDGTYRWAKSIGGVGAGTFSSGLALDTFRYIYTGGQFTGDINFGDPGTSQLTGGVNDGFVAKLKPLTVGISTDTSWHDGSRPVIVTITFSESVTGFTSDDIVVTHGTVANLSGSGTTYTFNLLPTGDEEITVSIPGDVVEGLDGDGNAPLAVDLSLYYMAVPLAWWPLAIVLLIGGLTVLRRRQAVRVS